MLLVVGLGNPGPEYAGNRHNVGFMAVDEIVRRHGFGAGRARFHGLTAEGALGGDKVLALKPQTYMNDSGRSVAAAVQFYKLPPERVIVVYDEIDLPLGRVRVKRGGGTGGHNGIRSIDAHIGPAFWRVRIGVGHPGHKELVHRHVLNDFAKAELPEVRRIVEAVAEALPILAGGDENGFMNKVSVTLNPPRPKPPRPQGNGAAARTDEKESGSNGL
ncbi:MAG: peptidyl-tRNA hydrolase [Alphaproteobacteria bacterium]|nr:MAG: peptidyl-tRNA hydrolase [Alphaproteobacteria bacterium]